MSKADYPYTGVAGQCAHDESKVTSFKNGGMVQERYVSNERLKELVSERPVSTGMVVTEHLRMYGSGILLEDNLRCSDVKKEINHQVTVVGYGRTDKKTVEGSWCDQYWVVMNSWGTNWGE